MARRELDIVAKIRVEGQSSLDQFNGKINTFRNSIRGVNFVLRTLGISLTTVLGGAAIRGFIRQQTELSNSMARTRFALAGLGGSLQSNLAIVNQFAESMQSAGIASANLAREVSARVLTSLKSQEQATRFARAALIGHKIQLFDAQAATTALASSTDENTSAFRNFLAILGIAAPEFASLDTLVENFIRRNQEAEQELTSFQTQFQIFVSNLKGLAENIGGFFADALTPVLIFFNTLVEDQEKAFALMEAGTEQFFRDTEELFIGGGDGIQSAWLNTMIQIGEATININNFVAEIIRQLFLALGRLFVTGINFLLAQWLRFLMFLGERLDTRIRFMLNLWVKFINFLGRFLGAGIFRVIRIWTTGWNFIRRFFALVVDDIKNRVESLVAGVLSAVNRITGLLARAREAAAAPITIVRNVVERITSAIQGKQLGGTVQALRPFVVGERGAELFVPSQAGNIIPAGRFGGGQNITIVIQGNTFQTDEEGARRIGDLIVRAVERVHRFGLTT